MSILIVAVYRGQVLVSSHAAVWQERKLLALRKRIRRSAGHGHSHGHSHSHGGRSKASSHIRYGAEEEEIVELRSGEVDDSPSRDKDTTDGGKTVVAGDDTGSRPTGVLAPPPTPATTTTPTPTPTITPTVIQASGIPEVVGGRDRHQSEVQLGGPGAVGLGTSLRRGILLGEKTSGHGGNAEKVV